MVFDELEHPIVQAPMAGGPSTPALAAAVSGAGGLGFLAAGYRSPDAMCADIRELRSATTAPFGVNLFVPAAADVDQAALAAYLDRLRSEARRYGTELGHPHDDDDGFTEKLAALREDPVRVVSFTFGCPDPQAVAALQSVGSEVWITVTEPVEAQAAEAVGADVLVCQGIEAGGHRGGFVDPHDAEGLGLLALLRLVGAKTTVPLVATGGLSDGASVAAVLAAGARGAQLGTAFLDAPEAATHPAQRQALATETPTALTRAFTGRTARGLRNRFLLEHSEGAPAAYPHIHHATAPLRAAARRSGDGGGFNLWAGQTHNLVSNRPAAEIVRSIAGDAAAALEGAATRLRSR